MMLVQQIKKEVAGLPKLQLKEFRSWFEEFYASEWDKRFENYFTSQNTSKNWQIKFLRFSKKTRCIHHYTFSN